MKNEKIDKYNKLLLSIIGTVLLAVVIISVLLVGGTLIYEWYRSNNSAESTDNALIIDNNERNNGQPVLRKQEITFSSPTLIDSATNQYIITVSRVSLAIPEELLDERMSFSISKGRYKRFSGSYNNLIVYNEPTNSKDYVFKNKIDISSYQINKYNGDLQIMLKGAMHDTNKDGKLTSADLQAFYCYHVQQKELVEIIYPDQSIIDYQAIQNSSKIILRFAIDKNKNGEYDAKEEPIYLKSFDLKTNKATDFLDQTSTSELQKMIE